MSELPLRSVVTSCGVWGGGVAAMKFVHLRVLTQACPKVHSIDRIKGSVSGVGQDSKVEPSPHLGLMWEV